MDIRRQLQALALMAGLITATALPAANDSILAEYNYYESGKIELNAGNYQQAITHYTNLRRLYPKSAYIPQSKLETAYAYYKLGDADAAIPLLQDFFSERNKHTHKPYAFYLAGLCKYQEALRLMEESPPSEALARPRAATEQAIKYFTQLVEKFPASQYSEDARQKTTYLLEKLVSHQVKVNEGGASQDRIRSESERTITWLMMQPPTYYTLQLAHTPDYDTAFDIASRYSLETKSSIIETITSEGISYTLLYGIYPTKREAVQANASLAPLVLQSPPSVRGMDSVQAEIVESRLLMNGNTTAESQVNQSPPPMTDILNVVGDNEAEARYRDWLLSQPPGDFTVQLMETTNEANLFAFINNNELAGQVVYYKTNHRNGPAWYSLLYGSYQGQAAATRAAQEIGARLRIAPPWIRSFKGIHNDLKNSN